MSGYRPAATVGVVEQDTLVYVAPLPDGPIVVLEGGAAAIWVAACDGPRESVAERVAALTGEAADDIRVDVESFVAELLSRGLLTAHES